MRTLLLTLLLFSIPVQAEQLYSKQECQAMHQAITSNFNSSNIPPKEMMSYYGKVCVVGKKDDSAHMSMIEAVLSNEIVVAIKAKLAEQDLVKL